MFQGLMAPVGLILLIIGAIVSIPLLVGFIGEILFAVAVLAAISKAVGG